MKKVFSFLFLISLIICSPAFADVIVGDTCTTHGSTRMTTDGTAIVACLKETVGSSTLKWKEMTGAGGDGTVTLVDSLYKGIASWDGTWTITGLTVGKPLILAVGSTDTSHHTYVLFRVISGAKDGLSAKYYCLNSNQAMPVGPSSVIIPTKDTVVLQITNLGAYTTFRAYQ